MEMQIGLLYVKDNDGVKVIIITIPVLRPFFHVYIGWTIAELQLDF